MEGLDHALVPMVLAASGLAGADMIALVAWTLGSRLAGWWQHGDTVLDGERTLQRILSRTFDIIAIFEHDRLTYVNQAGLQAMGVDRPEVVLGTPLLDFIHPDKRALSEARLERVRDGIDVPVIETTLVRPDGKTLEVELTSMRIEHRGRPAIQVVARDISERLRREQLIQSERDILELIAAGSTLHETLLAITRLVEGQVEDMLATILLVDEGGHVHIGAADSLPDWYNQEVEGQPIGPKAGSCGTAAYRKQVVLTPDIATDPLWDDYRDAALRAGLASSWSTPLFTSDGRVVGTLAYYYHVPQDPRPKDMQLAEVARHLAEIAIARAQADQALHKARQELEVRVAERTEQLRKDIAERKLAEERLRSRERLLTEAQSLAHMGSWEWDMVENEVRWSDELYRIYGLTPQAFGATFEAFLAQIRADDREVVRRVVMASAESLEPYAIEEHIIRPDGEERVLASSGRVELDESGRAARMWGVCLDITDRKRAEAEIQQLNAHLERRIAERTAQLEAANQELEAFSYSVSHDLRAPLRSIDGFSQALLEDYEGRLDETGQDYLHRVRAASQRMAQLIDDILHLSRLTRGEMRWEPIDVSALAREVIAEMRQADPERVVTTGVADGLSAQGDSRLFKAALENLIGNAWKFTSHHPTARIEVGAEARDGRTIFFVRDDGAGFEMTYADKLFKPFARLHTADEFPGSGIGLATVQRIIHRHGGRIWAEGAVERGATFYFTLEEGRP